MKKLLYIYDKKDWAIHNVGKLWLNGLESYLSIDFMEKPKKEVLSNYDYVWFGYHTLWLKRYIDFDKSKSIVSIHDPCELSGVSSDIDNGLTIVTASLQMKRYLIEKNIIPDIIIPTTGFMEINNNIKYENKIRLLSISSNQKRKNIDNIISLFDKCKNDLNIECYYKNGLNNFLPLDDYNNLFNYYNVYVCMSKEEGGPLPAIEAMQRGFVVLSTDVGQMPELINGNGFILKENEFFDKIKWLTENIDWFNNARLKSIENIKKYRDINSIKKNVKDFLISKGVIND